MKNMIPITEEEILETLDREETMRRERDIKETLKKEWEEKELSDPWRPYDTTKYWYV